MTTPMTLDTCKGYASVDNLMKALKRLRFDKDRFLIAYKADGKVTAVFPVSNFGGGGYVGRYAIKGFFTIG